MPIYSLGARLFKFGLVFFVYAGSKGSDETADAHARQSLTRISDINNYQNLMCWPKLIWNYRLLFVCVIYFKGI